MTRDEGVMLALVRLGKAGESLILAQRLELFTPPGQDFMWVALVSHVENEPVARGVEHAVNGHRQLDRAEVRGEMSARF